MVTIYDVAKQAGYSITTVSKVLNNYPNVSVRAKEKVLSAIKEMGYMPNASARALATNKSNMIAVVYSEALDIGITHPFFNEVIEAFRKQVELYNYDLLFVSRNIESTIDYYDHLKHRGVDGVVVVNSEEIAASFNETSIPSVFIDMHIDDGNSIYSDSFSGGMLAVDYLYELGHRKIAHITGKPTLFSAKSRIKGFNEGIKKNNLTVPANYIVDGGYFSYEGGRSAMMQLLVLPDRPTAVFVSGDEMALGAIKAIKEVGLSVPEDVSIIGFDDISLAKYADPALTTIKQDKKQLGRQAATLLLNEIDHGHKSYRTKVMPVRLIKRDSCRSYP